MQVAKVIGNIWATRKEEKLSGLKLLLVKPLDVLDETVDKSPLVAAEALREMQPVTYPFRWMRR